MAARKKTGQGKQQVGDTLENFATGLGTARDKNMQGRFVARYLMPDAELEASYEYDCWGRKIVDIPAFDMTREGRNWKADKTAIEAIEETETRLNFDGKLLDAITFGRLYGGAVIYLGIKGQDPKKELVPDSIEKDSLEFLHVLTKAEVSCGQRIRDVANPYFGQPESYRISAEKTGGQFDIHPSRVVRFIGASAPSRRKTDVWGNSVLQAPYDALRNSALATQGVAALVSEAKTDVFKVKGLTLKLADEDYRNRMVARVALSDYVKSITNATIMDAEEEWEQKTISFQSLPDVVRIYLQILAGASDIPVTRLLGESPKGLNSTGESDIRNYYDRIAAEQKMLLKPTQEPLIDAIIRSALGSRPNDVYYEFAPLWQLSEKEKSENNQRNALAAKTYADSGLVPVDALAKGVTNKMVEDGFYPGFDQALDESSEQPGEHKIETREAEAELAAMAAAGKLAQPGQPGAKPGAQPPKRVAAKDAEPRTLYVRRNVLNGAEILKWAKAQGLTDLFPADYLHTTIAYSSTPLDWMQIEGETWGQDEKGQMLIPPGGVRLVDKIGPKGTIALLYTHNAIIWRHEQIKRSGAGWDFPDYQPHISLVKEGVSVDISAIEPYRGKIILGPEIFEEVREGAAREASQRAA